MKKHDVYVKNRFLSAKFRVHCKTCRKAVYVSKWNEAMILALYHHNTGKWDDAADGSR